MPIYIIGRVDIAPLSNEHLFPHSRNESRLRFQLSRQGNTLIGGHFALGIKRDLKMIAASEETSIQALLDEARTKLLASRKKRSYWVVKSQTL